MTDRTRFNVLIVGGGTAGITVASSLVRRQGGRKLSIAVIEPKDDHYYQPAFTLVGAGTYSLGKTRRGEAQVMPGGVEWIKSKAAAFDPDNNTITLESGETRGYDYLVICPGLCLDWDKIEGATEALGSNGVCSKAVAGTLGSALAASNAETIWLPPTEHAMWSGVSPSSFLKFTSGFLDLMRRSKRLWHLPQAQTAIISFSLDMPLPHLAESSAPEALGMSNGIAEAPEKPKTDLHAYVY